MSGVSKYIQLELGDDNGKNCGAIAVSSKLAVKSSLQCYWCSTINVEQDWVDEGKLMLHGEGIEPSWFFSQERKLAKPKRSSDKTINGWNSEQEWSGADRVGQMADCVVLPFVENCFFLRSLPLLQNASDTREQLWNGSEKSRVRHVLKISWRICSWKSFSWFRSGFQDCKQTLKKLLQGTWRGKLSPNRESTNC